MAPFTLWWWCQVWRPTHLDPRWVTVEVGEQCFTDLDNRGKTLSSTHKTCYLHAMITTPTRCPECLTPFDLEADRRRNQHREFLHEEFPANVYEVCRAYETMTACPHATGNAEGLDTAFLIVIHHIAPVMPGGAFIALLSRFEDRTNLFIQIEAFDRLREVPTRSDVHLDAVCLGGIFGGAAPAR